MLYHLSWIATAMVSGRHRLPANVSNNYLRPFTNWLLVVHLLYTLNAIIISSNFIARQNIGHSNEMINFLHPLKFTAYVHPQCEESHVSLQQK